MRNDERRLAWGITGSGHYLRESLQLIEELEEVDVFLSRAGAEVLNMYGYPLSALRERMRIFSDTTASAAPVGLFYHGHYHTVVVAPTTSNTVAKMVCGISDTLITNIFAQAGKCRIPTIVFACDSEPVLETAAPKGQVMVYPREIDLASTDRLRGFEATTVVTTPDELRKAVHERIACLNASCS